jgi:hypothetical protein
MDAMVSAFCLMFGSYVDKRACEMAATDQIMRSSILSFAEICQSFSLELCGLMSSASAWVSLTKRHIFECPEEVINVITEAVLDILLGPPPGLDHPEADELPREPAAPLVQPAVVCPEDRPDMDDALSDASSGLREDRKHLTEVFLPDVDSQSEGGFSEAQGFEGREAIEDEGPPSPTDLLPPLALPPSAVGDLSRLSAM